MATPAFLLRLMNYRALSLAAAARLGPEDSEALALANSLRAATLAGRLRAVWTHPANELAGMAKVVKGKRTIPVQVAVARALGLITGAGDYLFLWEGGSAAIELKSASGRLTDNQRDFQDWCAAQGVPYFVARSAAAALDILRDLGRLV